VEFQIKQEIVGPYASEKPSCRCRKDKIYYYADGPSREVKTETDNWL